MKTLIMVALSAGLLVAGCGKDEAKKTEPGSKAAKTAEGAPQAVKPAEGTPAAKPSAAKVVEGKPAEAKPLVGNDVVGKPSVKQLKVEPVATAKPGPDAKAAADAPPEERVTGPVALVNGNAISAELYYAEVDKITRRSAKIPPERMNRIKENILKRLIEKQLIKNAVAKSEIKVPDAEIAKEFEQYKTRFRTEEQFQNYLRHGKVTIESIKQRISEKKELERLLEKTGKLAVTDADVQEFYNKNERFYQEREGVKARHVLIKVAENAPKDQEDKASAKVKEVQAALKAGTDFAEVAKKFSEGPSAPKGGDLGFFGRGQMVKPFEEKAFAMKPNEVSDPIRTRFGYHIINVLEKREARKKTLEEVKETISESLRNKKFFQERRALLNQLKTDAKIERKIDIPKSPTKASASPANPHGARVNPHGAAAPPKPAVRAAPRALAVPAVPTKPGVAPAPAAKAAAPAPAVKAAAPAPAK
ncbi:MAG: peptidyl-prolyl cis-trans isomerase C [Myxococcota bacterium]|jgi:peptidyl-prolyl cis-trans isomerase C